MKRIITLSNNGTVEWFDECPIMLDCDVIHTRRASHIVPLNMIKRAAFRLLRLVFGDRSAAASWTRSWRGPWLVRIVGSQRHFIHQSRRVCVEWERGVLNEDAS